MILRHSRHEHSRYAMPSSTLITLSLLLATLSVSAAPPSLWQQPQPGSARQQIAFSAPPLPPLAQSTSFSLVHAVHLGTHQHPGLGVHHRFDPNEPESYATLSLPQVHGQFGILSEEAQDDNAPLYALQELSVKSVKQKIWRPSHPARSEIYEAARRRDTARYRNDAALNELADKLKWEEVETDVPDIRDVQTLATLAKMSSNAYSTPKDATWYDLHSNDTTGAHPSYNLSSSFGWAEDGIRGHVFSSGPSNDTIVIAIKGTSAFVGGGGGTGKNDKLNDNLLFSCCCARVDWTWTPVCDCFSGIGKSGDQRCNTTCLEDALIEKSVYYPTATDLFNNITEMYPTSKIWLTGHSLGGSLAGLLGVTFGIPTVTFEAPGDLLPAKRLHLPLPPGADWHGDRPEFGITHVYTNSDPIPQGACTGVISTCNLVGFALETKCHTGQSIVYDAVGKLGWSVDVRTHRIGVIIDRLLIPDWTGDSGDYGEAAGKVEERGRVFVILPTLGDGGAETEGSIWQNLWDWGWPGKKRRNRDDDPSRPPDDDDSGDPDSRPRPTSSSSSSSSGSPSSTSSSTPSPTDPAKKKKSHVPPAEVDKDCQECFKWEFFDDYDGMPGRNGSSNATAFSAVGGLSGWRNSRIANQRRSGCGSL